MWKTEAGRVVRKCTKCGKVETAEEPLHEHHIIPRGGWEGTNSMGRVLLCGNRHNILGYVLIAHIGKKLKEKNIGLWEEMRKEIDSFTRWWVEQ